MLTGHLNNGEVEKQDEMGTEAAERSKEGTKDKLTWLQRKKKKPGLLPDIAED